MIERVFYCYFPASEIANRAFRWNANTKAKVEGLLKPLSKYEVATDVADVAVAGNDQSSTPNSAHDDQSHSIT